MNLEGIELRNTGPFAAAAGIGPFTDGLNVLAAANEAGKTSFLMGAARALFDRHTVTGEAIERLQPVGTSLAPEISVVFLTTEGRFKVHKRFLNSTTSELSEERDGEWHLIADGDAADGRVLELIGGVRPGRGVSKAEHWGLLRYLWARQGETADWPEWDDAAGTRIRSGLAQVDIDPLVERLRNQFLEAEAQQFTSTGRVAKNSPLQFAEQAVEKLESDRVQIRSQMEETDEHMQELQQHRDKLTILKREKTKAEKKAKSLTETLKQVELLRKDLERFEGAFTNAQERLNAIDKDKKSLNEAEAGLEAAEKKRTRFEGKEERARCEEKEAREELVAVNDRAKALQKKLDLGRQSETRWRDIQELRGLEEDLAKLKKSLDAARKQQEALAELRRKRAALPDVKKAQVTRLEKHERELRELAVRAESVGLRVSLKPERNATVSMELDGAEKTIKLAKDEATTVNAARRLHLKLAQWGEIDISSGAREAAEVEEKIAASRAVLDKDLKKIGVASVDHARTCVEEIRDLDRDIKAAESLLKERLDEWDSLESLQAGVEKAEADFEQSRARLNLSAEEEALSLAEIKAELAKIHSAIGADEKGQTASRKSIKSQEKRAEKCSAAREKTSKSVNQTKNDIASLEARRKTVNERYSEGIEKAEADAQTAFVEAKAQLEVARKKLPDDWERLESRQERALQAAAQTMRDYQDTEQKIRRLETLLEHSGSQGLYSRETELDETLVSAKNDAERLRNNALAARLLAALIDYRKKAAVKTVLKPLEDQLSATFAEITGIPNRRVFLDENLQVAGIGRKRNETIHFDQLSQGAREQLLLALRAAVALELAKSGPQILILDDVLVNTDATRQENVLDFVQNVAQHLQVLIVTCHAERYRGVGHTLNIEPVQMPE